MSSFGRLFHWFNAMCVCLSVCVQCSTEHVQQLPVSSSLTNWTLWLPAGGALETLEVWWTGVYVYHVPPLCVLCWSIKLLITFVQSGVSAAGRARCAALICWCLRHRSHKPSRPARPIAAEAWQVVFSLSFSLSLILSHTHSLTHTHTHVKLCVLSRFDKLVYVGINEDRETQLQVLQAIIRK